LSTFNAFAPADLSVFCINFAPLCGIFSKIESASVYVLRLIRFATGRILYGEQIKNFDIALYPFAILISYYFAAFLSDPACPRNIRVGANSPSLCPTRFSVMYTGTHIFPLYTEIVIPTISGMMVEQREYVLIIRRSVDLLISKIFLYKLFSMKGPFFIDRDTFTPYRNPIFSSCGLQ
jgi:hypothetical protein